MKKKNTRLISLGILIAVLVTSMVYRFYYRPKGDDATTATEQSATAGNKDSKSIPVKIFMPRTEQVADGIRSIGTLLPSEQVDVASETTGKIVEIAFDEGAVVKKGQLLVRVDDRDLVAQLKRAQFNLDMVKERLGRQRILLAKDAVSRESFDQVETEFKMLEADVELLKIKVDRTQIRAPFDGVIGFRYVSVGSYIQPNTKIANMVDNSMLKIEFSIPEKYMGEDLKGRQVHFSTESSDKTYQAEVYAVDPRVDSKTRTVILRALFRNTSSKLVSGMFARVSMPSSGGAYKSLMIPTEAVIPQSDGKTVWVVRDGKASSVIITTGTRTGDMIEVLSGVTAVDSVITTGVMQLREGATVLIE